MGLARWAAWGVGLAAAMATARADRAAEIIEIHTAVIGGSARIAALQAYRASGYLITGGQRVPIVVTAARPQRLRVELRHPDRTVVQGSDGVAAPWQQEIRPAGGAAPAVPLTGAAAEQFRAAAEFDDPLVGAKEYGCTIEYAGETRGGEERWIRLLVTQRLARSYFLLVDPATYLIAARVEEIRTADGHGVRTTTRYGDYRPVAGILWPHRVSVITDGDVAREAIFSSVQANPSLPSETFARPP